MNISYRISIILWSLLAIQGLQASEIAPNPVNKQATTVAHWKKELDHYVPQVITAIIVDYIPTKGNIFIVPNRMNTVSYIRDEYFTKTQYDKIRHLFPSAPDNELCIEAAIVSEGHGQWAYKDHPDLPSDYVPMLFPISIFKNKKELTDNEHEKTVTIEDSNLAIILKLTLANMRCKYAYLGAFDKALERCLASSNHRWSNNHYESDLKEYEDAKKAAEGKNNDSTNTKENS